MEIAKLRTRSLDIVILIVGQADKLADANATTNPVHCPCEKCNAQTARMATLTPDGAMVRIATQY